LKRKGEGSNVGSFFRVLELNLMALPPTPPLRKEKGRGEKSEVLLSLEA